MKNFILILIFIAALGTTLFAQNETESVSTEVLVVGGSASGTMAGIQSARMGASTLIVEETPWLGGMLTSAGVSAIDGNYRLHSGLWNEFRQLLCDHYGGPDSLKTGWVSNVLFEPQVGESILSEMADREKELKVLRQTRLTHVQKTINGWEAVLVQRDKKLTVQTKVVIDATELGDVAKQVGIPYDIGMDARYDTGEAIAPEKANNIIQDLTYVAILKEYGDSIDATIPKPDHYDPTPFLCTCAGRCNEDSLGKKLWNCDFMMKYGKLPNGYYMINWPIYGNDYYVNVLEMNAEEREVAFGKAKNFTLQYIYYLQHELGFRHLGLADDVYPSADNLPFIPYHRESRRIKGLVRFTVNDMAKPFGQPDALYRTGIAVGDYPVDHHHQRYQDVASLPELHFYPVPSYNLPLGVLIPANTDDFIVAEKSISVTNIVNGTTRLQPVCMLIGQASGALAALAVKNGTTPANVQVRDVQKTLLNSGAYLMPYSDVAKEAPYFNALQRIGATGILRGESKNIGWENHTHIYPDSVLTKQALQIGLADWMENKLKLKNETVSGEEALKIIRTLGKRFKQPSGNQSVNELKKEVRKILISKNMKLIDWKQQINRAQFAVVIDELLNPFEIRQVDHRGHFVN